MGLLCLGPRLSPSKKPLYESPGAAGTLGRGVLDVVGRTLAELDASVDDTWKFAELRPRL